MVPFTVHPYRERRLTVPQPAVRVRPAGGANQHVPRQLNKGESMDWKRFDRARRTVGPEELDLIESYAEGRINRRDFVRRGTVIGLSVPFLGAVIAACGGDDDDASTDTEADGGTGHDAWHRTVGHRRDRDARAASSASPRRSRPARSTRSGCRTSARTASIAQCFEFLTTLGDEGAHRARTRRVVGAERGRQRLDVQSAPGRQVARRHRLHVGRRGGHARPARGRRQRRAEGRHRRRLGRRHRSGNRRRHAARRRTATSRTSCRSSTPSR